MLRAEQFASAKGAFKAGRGRESVALAWHGLRIHICAPSGGQRESSAARKPANRQVFGPLPTLHRPHVAVQVGADLLPGFQALAGHGWRKTGGRLVKHARYYWLLLAEGHLTRRRFGVPDRAVADTHGIDRRWPAQAAESVYKGLGKEKCCKRGGISGNFGGAGADLRPLGTLRMRIVSQCREQAG
jgi:hypothetical protein